MITLRTNSGSLLPGLLTGMAGLVLALPASGQSQDPPATIQVTGIVRDFVEEGEPNGHPDFGDIPPNGLGRYSGNIAVPLAEDRRPVFVGTGKKVSQQWRDSQNRQICHCVYGMAPGDIEGSWGQPGTGGVTSGQTFFQWYHDAPGWNMSAPLTLTLVHQGDGTYLFDDELDPYYDALGGFFPIDGQLFGDVGQQGHNYFFTFELHVSFLYDASQNQFFKFTGDDDVYVFIDGKLVIDLGGVHAAHDQLISVDRLGLQDGQHYPLDFFFSERREPESSFSIWTNMLLEPAAIGSVTATYD